MPLKEHLELAQRAIDFTRNTVKWGSNNKKEDDEEPERKSRSQRAESNIWESLNDFADNRRRARRTGHVIRFTFLDEVREVATQVKLHQAGNCGFQAYVALEWILANSTIRPVSVVNIIDESDEVTHCMIAIGDLSNRDEAVLCDPHQIQFYPLSAFDEGEYQSKPIGARTYGDTLAVRFQRNGPGSIDEAAQILPDEEYSPPQPIGAQAHSSSCAR